jgi:transposase
MGKGASAEQVVREIQRRTRRRFSVEEKVRIVLEGLRGEASVAELCRREGPGAESVLRWSKESLEAGKKRLLGDTTREATAPEVRGLRDENLRLKQALAEAVLENRLLKKSATGSGSEDDTCG